MRKHGTLKHTKVQISVPLCLECMACREMQGGPKKYALPIIKVGITNAQRLCCSQSKSHSTIVGIQQTFRNNCLIISFPLTSENLGLSLNFSVTPKPSRIKDGIANCYQSLHSFPIIVFPQTQVLFLRELSIRGKL